MKQSFYHQNCHRKFPERQKIETRKTNHVNSTDPTHSKNNIDEGMTHTRLLIRDVPFHPGPTYRPPENLLDPMCLEDRKVHIVHLVQKIFVQILI